MAPMAILPIVCIPDPILREVEENGQPTTRPIQEIHGEAFTQLLERFPTRKLPTTGGGLVTSPEASRLLRERARTVWLKASADEHWQRVVKQGDLRPMANRPQAMAELRRRLKEREPLYAAA